MKQQICRLSEIEHPIRQRTQYKATSQYPSPGGTLIVQRYNSSHSGCWGQTPLFLAVKEAFRLYLLHNKLLPLLFFNFFFLQTVKFLAIAQEQAIMIACIIAEVICKRTQLLSKVQRYEIPFLLQSLLCQIFPILRKNYINNN